MVNKINLVNIIVLHTFLRNITRSAIISRETIEKTTILKIRGEGW